MTQPGINHENGNRDLGDTIAPGIDVGGTWVRAGMVDGRGCVLTRRHYAISKNESADALIDRLGESVAALGMETQLVRGGSLPLGLALPGLIDRRGGFLTRSISLPELVGVPLVDRLAARTGLKVVLLTDAEAATWGEYISRQPPRPSRFVHLRLGTGVAVGAVLEGKLQQLDDGRTAHLELLIVDRSCTARLCRCGLRGCLETVASGAFLDERATQLGLSNGAAGLQKAFEGGDRGAVALIEEAAKALAAGIANLCEAFNPDVICLGGGVIAHLPCLLERTRARREAFTGEACGQSPLPLVSSARGDDAGVVGAALLAQSTG